jgi:TonB family protein
VNNLSPSTTSSAISTSDSRIMSYGMQRVQGILRSCVLVCCELVCVLAWCTPIAPIRVNPLRAPLADSERRLRRVPAHISEFNPVSEPLALPRCGSVRPPEALLTPDPLLPAENDDLPVRVSFIVGSDGHVHSAFVLNGAGPDEDEAVLRAVRQWRYRPALCNGVPTDSEARVRFILH